MAALLCGGLGLPLCPVTRTTSTTTTALASSSSQSSSRIITTTSLSSVSFGTPSFSNTFSTSFVASASLIASSIQTSSISSSFGLSPTSILTIRTTSTSTTPNSSQIPSSTTAASPVPTGPTCPAADGQSFTAQDGSQYLIVCNRGYSSNSQNVFGLIPVAVNSYLDCLNLCFNQGSICAGITYGYFGSDTLQCNLKTKMLRDNQPSGYNVDSALRMSGPTVSGNRSQLVTNGDFMENMGSLSPWTTDTFSIEGISGVPTSYWVLADSFGYKAGELIQAVNISAGLSYYMTLSLSFSTSGPISPNNFCNFYAQTDYEILFFFNPNLTSFTSAFSSTFNASGTTTRDANRFILFMYCSGNFNITWTIDSVAFYTNVPSLGANPLVPPPSTSILRDGNFTSGLQYWRWRPNPNLNNNVLSPSSIATVLLPPGTLNNVTALMNYMMPSSLVPSTPGLTPQQQQQQQQQQQRLTVITFSTLSPVTPTFTSGYLTQIAPLPISLNQTFRLTGTVYFNVSSSCSCDAGIYNTLYRNSGVNGWAWSVFGVRERRVVEVDVTGMATAGNAEFQVYVGCEGTDAGCGVGVGGLAMRVNV